MFIYIYIYGISHISPDHSRATATSLATGATGATGLFLLQALGIAPLGPFSEPDLHSVQRCPAMSSDGRCCDAVALRSLRRSVWFRVKLHEARNGGLAMSGDV